MSFDSLKVFSSVISAELFFQAIPINSSTTFFTPVPAFSW